MKQFCTSCGAPDHGSAFCTSCGTMIRSLDNSATSTTTIRQDFAEQIRDATSSQVSVVPENRGTRKRKFAIRFLVIAMTVILGALGGFFFGRISIDLENERSIAFESGFEDGTRQGKEAGFADGFQSGKESGYRDGYLEGCYFVFDKIGPDLIAIEYPWYDSNVYGYRWNKFDVC